MSLGFRLSSCANSRLFYTQVGIDTGVACCACEVLVFSVRYVLFGPGVPVLLSKSKVNDEQLGGY